MRRPLLNLATFLSLLLTAAAVGMWLRSQSVPEVWGFTLRPIPKPRWDFQPGVQGWGRWRSVGSDKGRLVWVSVDERQPGSYTFTGYHQGQFMPPDWMVVTIMRETTPTGLTHGEIPGVVEWASLNVSGGGRFVRVVTLSWLVPAFVGAVFPAVRLWPHWRRTRGPTFPVVVPT